MLNALSLWLIAAWVFHRSAEHSMNVEGAFRHVMADLMGSVGLVISGIVILTLGWTIVVGLPCLFM